MTSSLQKIVATSRGGRMTKWKGCVASAAPYMLVATVSSIALSVGMAQAETISTDVVGPEVLAVGEDHEITATGSVTLTSSSAAAVEIDGDYANTFTNTGVIEVTGTSVETGTGLVVSGDLLTGGQVVNNGTITLDHTYTSDVSSYGIRVNGLTNGTISNTGSITLNHTQRNGDDPNNTDDFEGYGISTANVGATGQIINSGTISVFGLAESTASAFGIYVDGDNDGTIVNSGTIEIEALGVEDYGYAYGIVVDDMLGATGSIVNSGRISAKGVSTTDSTASAYGILVENDAFGAVTNTGTIDALASAQTTYEALAFGIDIDDELSGSVTNTGTITAKALSVESDASAYGIRVDDDMLEGSTLTNSGTISAIAFNETDDGADAYGIQVDGQLQANTSVSNTGSITADASSIETEAEAYGIHVDSSMLTGSSLTNSGTIVAKASSVSDYAEALGIEVDGAIEEDAAFSNTGTISATATSDDSEAIAYGVKVDGNLGGAFSNAGSITATSESEAEGTAYGIYVRRDLTGSLTNSGTITARATDVTSSAEAYGIVMSGSVTGTLANSGTITATATNTASSDAGLYAIGMDISNVGADGTVTNSGSISAVANNLGAATYVTAYGIDFGTVDGTFSNSGTISAVSNDDADVTSADVIGVTVSTLNGTLSNTGTISASSDADTDLDDVEVYGLFVGELNGEITDAGTITATGSGENVYAIYLGDGTGTLNLDSDNDITGKMSVAAHNVNLFASGRSTVFVFEDRDTGAGEFDATVAGDHLAWFVDDEGGAAPVYASVNSADLDAASATVASNGNLLGALGDALPGGGSTEATRNRLSFGGGALSGMRPFVSASAESNEYEGVDGANDSEAVTTNATFGYAGQLQSGLGLSVGLGVFQSDGSSGPTDFDSTGYFAGVTVGQDLSGFDVQGGIGFGSLTTDNTRAIAGSTDAESSSDSTFTTVHLGVSRTFSQAAGISWTGFGEVRYTNQNVGGYTETGSLANATVDDFTIATTQTELGVEGTYYLNDGSAFTGALSAISRTASGDDEIDVTVFGSTASLASVASDFSGSSLSIGYERDISAGGLLNVGAAQEFGDGAAGPTFSASISWTF